GSGFIRAGSRTVSLRNFQKEIFRHAAVLLHHLRRIAREMLFEYLIHTARMPQSRVRFMLTQLAGFAAAIFTVPSAMFFMAWRWPGKQRAFLRRAFVEPRSGIVLLLFRVPTGEEPAQVFRVAEVFAQNSWRICV